MRKKPSKIFMVGHKDNEYASKRIVHADTAFDALHFSLREWRYSLGELDSGFEVFELTNKKDFKVDYTLNIKEVQEEKWQYFQERK